MAVQRAVQQLPMLQMGQRVLRREQKGQAPPPPLRFL